MMDWIPVKEKEPVFPCVVCDANGNRPYTPDAIVSCVMKGHGRVFFDAEWWRQDGSNTDFLVYENRIIAWLPLPPPYTEKDEKRKDE